MLPQLITIGVVNLGGSFLEPLYIFPMIIAVPLGLVMTLFTMIALIADKTRLRGMRLIATGHLISAGLSATLMIYAATSPNATGWELAVLPMPIAVGQLVVLAGLLSFRKRVRA